MRKLRHTSTSRRDVRVYGMLLVGAMFVYAGLTLDPASNCDASGRQCAPWLVPVAFFMGVVFAVVWSVTFGLGKRLERPSA